MTTNAPRSRRAGCSRPGRASTAVDRWAWPRRWRSGSRRRCDRRPSCPTSPGRVSPRRRFAQFGTPEQIDRLLVPLLRGDEWWALGMSEPEAGSDFAGLRTRAVRDGPRQSLPGQGQKDLDHPSAPLAVVHAVRPHRSRRTQAPRNLLSHPRSRIPRGDHRTHSHGIDLR